MEIDMLLEELELDQIDFEFNNFCLFDKYLEIDLEFDDEEEE